LSLRSEESSSRALEEFRDAIVADPNFAKAYAGMATTHLIRADYLFAPVLESVAKAEELARQALQIDPSLGEAHAVLGYASFRHDWNASLAEKELRQAIELDPNQAVYHVWFAVLLSDEGRFDESFQQIDLAHADDPLWAPIYGAETFLAANARQSAREMGAAQKLIGLMPGWPAAHDELAWSLWHAKRYADAIGEWKRMALLEGDQKRADLEDRGLRAFRSGGVPAYARVRLSWIKSGADPDRHANDFVPAEWYAYADEKDNAVRALEEMVAHHDPDALQMAVGPEYSDLHRDPRFRALLTRLNLPLQIASPKDSLRSSLK
jgi:tetratricopeptide (TPR) repeat protein